MFIVILSCIEALLIYILVEEVRWRRKCRKELNAAMFSIYESIEKDGALHEDFLKTFTEEVQKAYEDNLNHKNQKGA